MRIFILIYVIAGTLVSLGSMIMETYPARLIIDLFAPHPGDNYPASLTWLLTFMVLLFPLVVVLLIIKMVRNREKASIAPLLDNEQSHKTGILFIRQKQLQSGLIASPVRINGEQRGKIDSGKTLFIELFPGSYEVEAGGKGQASDPLTVQVAPEGHTRVDIHIVPNGMKSKYVVEVV